jgi:hypothetical protein
MNCPRTFFTALKASDISSISLVSTLSTTTISFFSAAASAFSFCFKGQKISKSIFSYLPKKRTIVFCLYLSYFASKMVQIKKAQNLLIRV